MRGLIFFVAVLLAGAAHAGDFAQPFIVGVTSTMTVSAVSITSTASFDITISTRPLYRQVCVQNQDPAGFLACSDNVNVSTLTNSGLFGVYLATNTATAPAVPFCFEIVPGSKFFCRSSQPDPATSRAVIIRKR